MIWISLVAALSVSGAAPDDASSGVVKKKKPVSVSYEAVLSCFPELEDNAFVMKVDLGKLKERMDLLFATERSTLQSRVVKFTDPEGVERRLKLEERLEGKPIRRPVLAAQWETLLDSGTIVSWDDPSLKKTNPSISDINAVLAKSHVRSDERVDFDTKLKGLTLRTRRDFTKVLELRLEDTVAKKTLTCQDKADFGAICLCRKK